MASYQQWHSELGLGLEVQELPSLCEALIASQPYKQRRAFFLFYFS